MYEIICIIIYVYIHTCIYIYMYKNKNIFQENINIGVQLCFENVFRIPCVKQQGQLNAQFRCTSLLNGALDNTCFLYIGGLGIICSKKIFIKRHRLRIHASLFPKLIFWG